MSKSSPLNEQEQADLVAYLDGELTGEAARAMEARLSLNPKARAEADSLKRTWELLDFLPRPEPSASFTQNTLSKLLPIRKSAPTPVVAPATNRRRLLVVGGWAAALLVAAVVGYQGTRRLTPQGPGDAELLRDLRLIENKRFYDLVDDVDFLRQLDQPDLFGEESMGP